jgi:Glyoxalase/Bleomycin resistance protein/Dioxygenase superfamily
MNKVTPLLTVDEIEPCLPFWTDGLGFEVTVSVPHEDRIGFAILQKGPVEIMYQTRASIDADLGTSGAPAGLGAELTRGTATLFVEVDGLDDVIAVLGDTEVIVPRRQTFYGMDEIFVRPPCGTLVGFAARVATE